MRVDIITFLHILQNVIVLRWHSFLLQLVKSALGTNFGRSCDKYLQFGIGKDNGSYVATIHNNTFIFPHLLLLRNQSCSDKWDSSNLTDVLAHTHRTYFLLYTFVVKVSVGL